MQFKKVIFLIVILSFFSVIFFATRNYNKIMDYNKACDDFLDAAFYMEYYGNVVENNRITPAFINILKFYINLGNVDKVRNVLKKINISGIEYAIIIKELAVYYKKIQFPNIGLDLLNRIKILAENEKNDLDKLYMYSILSEGYQFYDKNKMRNIILDLLKKDLKVVVEKIDQNTIKLFFEIIKVFSNEPKANDIKDILNKLKSNIEKKGDIGLLSDFYFYTFEFLPDYFDDRGFDKFKNNICNVKSNNSEKLKPVEISVLTTVSYISINRDENIYALRNIKGFFDNDFFDKRIFDVLTACVKNSKENYVDYISKTLVSRYRISRFKVESLIINSLLDNDDEITALKKIFYIYPDFLAQKIKDPDFIYALARTGEFNKAVNICEYYYTTDILAKIGFYMNQKDTIPNENQKNILGNILNTL